MTTTIIQAQLPCRECGYSLRGLDARGNCPECGCDVRRSLFGLRLDYLSPRYLARLHWGRLLAVCYPAGVLIFLIGMMAGATIMGQVFEHGPRELKRIAEAVFTAYLILGATALLGSNWLGFFLILSPNPALRNKAEFFWPRRAGRIACWLLLALLIAAGATAFLLVQPGNAALHVVAAMLGGAAAIAWCVTQALVAATIEGLVTRSRARTHRDQRIWRNISVALTAILVALGLIKLTAQLKLVTGAVHAPIETTLWILLVLFAMVSLFAQCQALMTLSHALPRPKRSRN